MENNNSVKVKINRILIEIIKVSAVLYILVYFFILISYTLNDFHLIDILGFGIIFYGLTGSIYGYFIALLSIIGLFSIYRWRWLITLVVSLLFASFALYILNDLNEYF